VTPHSAEPFYVGLVLWFAQLLQVADDVFAAHLAEGPEQVAGVVEHDAWIFALANKLWNPFAHAFVAPGKDAGVVVVTFALMLEHVLKVADGIAIWPSGDGGLVHVEGAGESSGDVLKVEVGVGGENAIAVISNGSDRGFPAAYIGQSGAGFF